MKRKPLHFLFDAMYHGKYEFADFLTGDIAKNYEKILVKGKSAYRPNKKLRAYHNFLNQFLCEYLTVNTRAVYSYRKGVNPHLSVLPHAHSRAFFQTDITDFFGSIGRDLVMSTLLESSQNIPISDLHAHIDRFLDLTVIEGKLPIGFSTSPPISNAALTRFDNDIESYCLNSQLVYTRYADDIVISSQHRDQLANIEGVLNEHLKRHFFGSLSLNPAKSKLTTIGRKVKVLGMVVLPSGRVTIDMDLKKRVEVLLHFYTKNREKFLAVVSNDMKAGIEQLAGYVNYINTADKEYLEKLRKKFGSTVIDSFLHRSAT